MEYMKQLLMAEKSRQDHEIALVEAASTVQKLEIERINQQKSLLNLYTQTIVNTTPKIKTVRCWGWGWIEAHCKRE